MTAVIEQFANNAASTLNGNITSSATTLVVTSASTFPSAPNFRIEIDSEIMMVTGVSGTTFTVTRGYEGTTAASHTSAATVTHVFTAGVMAAAFPNSETCSGNVTMQQGCSYFVDTTGGVANLTFPAPVAGGGTIRIKDAKGNFQTNNCNLLQHASEKLEYLAQSYPMIANGCEQEWDTNGTDWFIMNTASKYATMLWTTSGNGTLPAGVYFVDILVQNGGNGGGGASGGGGGGGGATLGNGGGGGGCSGGYGAAGSVGNITTGNKLAVTPGASITATVGAGGTGGTGGTGAAGGAPGTTGATGTNNASTGVTSGTAGGTSSITIAGKTYGPAAQTTVANAGASNGSGGVGGGPTSGGTQGGQNGTGSTCGAGGGTSANGGTGGTSTAGGSTTTAWFGASTAAPSTSPPAAATASGTSGGGGCGGNGAGSSSNGCPSPVAIPPQGAGTYTITSGFQGGQGGAGGNGGGNNGSQGTAGTSGTASSILGAGGQGGGAPGGGGGGGGNSGGTGGTGGQGGNGGNGANGTAGYVWIGFTQ